MPALADINKKDETASKPDTGKYGLEPFMAGSGYAMVICCPIYAIVGIVGATVHKVKKRKQSKAGEQEAGEKEAGEQTQPADDDNSRTRAQPKSTNTKESTSAGLERDTRPPEDTERLKEDPKNPRTCDPQCPGYAKANCAVHHRPGHGRPTSPGLLAV